VFVTCGLAIFAVTNSRAGFIPRKTAERASAAIAALFIPRLRGLAGAGEILWTFLLEIIFYGQLELDSLFQRFKVQMLWCESSGEVLLTAE
jgi:hypothetical protein